MLQRIGAYFLRGLITLLPLLVTIWLLWLMFDLLDGILGRIISLALGRQFPGLGLLLMVVIIFLTGYFATYIFTAKIFKFGEQILYRVPIVKSIYASVKQVNDVLFVQKSADEYRRACILEWPRKGVWSVGFITSDAAAEIEAKAKEKMINVFVANTPTPATGFLVIVPAREVILLDMKIEDAFKYLVSAGVIKPGAQPKEVPIKKEV
jgi:uncharacterized membrane protein